MRKKTYVLDTSVYLTDPTSIRAFKNNDIVIPIKVLEELDKHKNRQDAVGLNARSTIRTLDTLRTKGNLHKGVRLEKGKGLVFVKPFNPELLPQELKLSTPDNQIIATALTEKNTKPGRKVILVSRDIHMRVMCDALGIESEEYKVDQVVDGKDFVYSGYRKLLLDDQKIDSFYEGGPVVVDPDEYKINPNEFLMLISNANDKKTALARFVNYETPLQRLNEYKKKGVWGIKPKNKEQLFALNLLLNPEISVVSLIGRAGSGKTLLAIAAGLEQVLESKEGKYTRLIVSRPVQPMGKDIGFLPGTLTEKMLPWIAPIQDNLECLMGGDRYLLDEYMQQGVIEIEALTYIRGRSISNAYIIIDEAQNLNPHELKTILTRVGENTKIILTGDIEQIDSIYLDETTNGLTHAVEKFKKYAIAGHASLHKGERSKVASLAAKIL